MSDVWLLFKLCSAELTRLTQEYSIRTQLEVYCKDKTSKEEQIRRLWVCTEFCLYSIVQIYFISDSRYQLLLL